MLKGVKPKLEFDLPERLTPEFTLLIFKLIWMMQLYSEYKARREGKNYSRKDCKLLKSDIRDSILSQYGFSIKLCRTRALLLRAYWHHKSTNTEFEKKMKELVRVKRSLETEIYADKEIEELSEDPKTLQVVEFNKWYENIEKRYKKIPHEGFSEVKEEQLYKWKNPPTKMDNFLGFFAKFNEKCKKAKEKEKKLKEDIE